MTTSRLLAAALLTAAACAPDPDQGVDDLGTIAPHVPIIYGGSRTTEALHGAVVSLHEVGRLGGVIKAPFCTGTLIAPDVVLTAAHCLDVAGWRARRFETVDPADVAVFVGDQPRVELPAHSYRVTEALIHPRYDRVETLHDVGLLRLAAPVTEAAPIPPLPAALGFTAADVGRSVTFVGFGDTERGTYGVKLAVDVPLAGPGCAVRGCEDPGYPAVQISYDQTGGVGPCSGDSGGPLLLRRGPLTFVAGVTSYGDARCVRYGVSARVDAYESFIQAFLP